MRPSKTDRHLRRRDFLKLSAGAVALGLLESCSPAAQPTPTTPPAPTKPASQAATPAAQPTKPPANIPTVAPTAVPTVAAGPKKGGTLTIARSSSIQNFNPMYLQPGHFMYMRALFNTLAHYDSQLQLAPELAEKWSISSDGKAMTLQLRQGVKYHSGREFT
ncbi:MAG: twin-arginine translocation signal domain-containing protein, partial [Dehalococcoidales bacterium]|nr:twin-arginine translocation signal domain-containing protein [Dehalococcoidales bacterium]